MMENNLPLQNETAPRPKRLLLYAHYDRDGQVDPHVVYQIKALHDFGISIIFISNSPVSEEDKQIISPFIIELRLRPDEGYDWTAWKEAILALGLEGLSKYDELIIMNDSCYGPVFPLEEMFSKMDKAGVDFWGITENMDPNYIDHIQPYFCVFKSSIIKSDAFLLFWNELEKISNYIHAVYDGELRMTEYFCKKGYKYNVYANLPNMTLTPEIGVEHPFVFSVASWLIQNYHVPFIKIKAFRTQFGKQFNTGSEIFNALNECESEYPIQLIFDNIRRTKPLSWHKNLPGTLNIIDENISIKDDPHLNIAVFAHIFYEDQANEAINWLCNIPYLFDLYVSTSSKKKSTYIHNIIKNTDKLNVRHTEIRVMEDRGRDVATWLLGFKDVHCKYDVALKFHLKKRPEPNPVFAWEWNHFLMQSSLASPGYVADIIHMFKKSENLGLVFHIFPPVLTLLIHQQDSIRKTMKWKEKILKRLNSNAPEESSWSIYSNNIFWYRPKSLHSLIYSDININEFPEEPFPSDGTIAHGMERAIPYIAHGNGYYYKLVIPSSLIIPTFQHYEDHILHLEASGYIRPIREKIKEDKKEYMKFYYRYCKYKPGRIPIGRAFQIAFMSLYEHIIRKIKKILVN